MFSPYYASARRGAARRGQAADPHDHCAINVALYNLQTGQKKWAMTERGRASLARDAVTLGIGPSSLRWDGDALLVQVEEVTVPWPSRLRGSVRVHPAGAAPRRFALDAQGLHHWWPIAPAATVEVHMDSPAWRWSGTGYVDSNQGDGPLEDGFASWQWSRAALPQQGCGVLYDVQGRDGSATTLALQFDARGDCQPCMPPPQATLAPAAWGIARATRCESAHRLVLTHTLEDAPFYARSLLRSAWQGEPVVAVHESLSLTRFAAPWVQRLLPFRMPRRAG